MKTKTILLLFLLSIIITASQKKPIEYAYVLVVNRYIVEEKQESELKKELLKLVAKYKTQFKEFGIE